MIFFNCCRFDNSPANTDAHTELSPLRLPQKHPSKTSIGPPKTKPTVQSSSYVIYYLRIRQCAPYIHRSPHCTKFVLLKLNYITCLSVWSKLHFLNINTLDGLVWNRLTMRAYRSKMAPWLPPRKGFAFPFTMWQPSQCTQYMRERERERVRCCTPQQATYTQTAIFNFRASTFSYVLLINYVDT